VSNYIKNFDEKLYQLAKMATRNVWCSQNRIFKVLPVNFRYNRTSREKSKNVDLSFLLAVGNLFANILFRSQMAATKLVGCFKKKVT
jgi:hypothetical protein